ncbi:ESX secretion-associated protein EspG [Amycolatopsis sp. SID8362]|uniref:ESX secretion-associated protein EspG n=1 Tax=Amycolatopsis sp. SID8362 TaxID=2690346 RepID=UPI001371AD90|nr:ESX secretion-associated protein EspG [Amycolatopsis sp. SID8362]NBH08583.1 hypothetical protein [Amycolatopsis sp. SID8362]NED45277.1 hypothetical protein [Amycolatopsis sp. SID8362]
MAIQFSFVLDGPQTALLGYSLRVPVNRYPLVLPPVDPDPDQRDHATELLRNRRLAGKDAINPHVRTAFSLFGDCRVEAALSGIDEDGAQFRALGLSDGRQALVVSQVDGDDEIGFRLLSDDDWIDELAAAAPDMPAASGRELVVEEDVALPAPRSAFAARLAVRAAADEQETRSYEQEPIMSMVRAPSSPFHGRTRTDRDVATAALSRERLGSGRVVVTGHGRRRARPATTAPIAWFDTSAGRYLLRSATDDARITVRLRPGGTAALAAAIRDAVSDVY